MVNFMNPTMAYGIETFPHFDKKVRLAEATLEWIRCRLRWNEEGKASLITEYNQDITDRFMWIFYDDAERLHWTEIEGIIMIKQDINYMGKENMQDILQYNKEWIEKILQSLSVAWYKLMFVATDVITFLWEDYTQIGYGERKMKVEDVLIGIDNTFEMKYKDYYSLCRPTENSKENFFKVFNRWHKGMTFKNINSKYAGGVSEDWIELYGAIE